MDAELCKVEFMKLAHRLGIEIRYTSDGPSGLCTIKGEQVLFIDKALSAEGQISMFVREFKSLELDGIFLVPVIRKLLGLDNETTDW